MDWGKVIQGDYPILLYLVGCMEGDVEGSALRVMTRPL